MRFKGYRRESGSGFEIQLSETWDIQSEGRINNGKGVIE